MASRSKKESNPVSWSALVAAGVGTALGLRALMREKVSFKDRTVLVTGGSRGLGLVMARQFVAEGARVIIVAREEVELARARDELSASGGEVLALACDVTDRVQVEAMVGAGARALRRGGRAGEQRRPHPGGPARVHDEEDFAEAMDVHFWGPLYTTLAVLPEMKRRGWGRIVNISSIGGTGERAAPGAVLARASSRWWACRTGCARSWPRTASSSRRCARG